MSRFNSAVILAGGKSTRMGFDKQLLQMQNKTVMEHLISLLATKFGDIMISSSTPELYQQANVRVIHDIYENIGPLGGIHSALQNAKSEGVFVIACDMPYLEFRYMDYMIEQMSQTSYDACVTERGGFLEVFHSFYLASALPALESELEAGHYSVQKFTRKINTLIIPEKIAAGFLPEWRAFTNLNTPQEYEDFRRQILGDGDDRGSL